MEGRRPITPGRLRWLEEEIESWRCGGLIDDEAAGRIRGSYEAGTRAQVTRLFLGLGALLAGVGLIWLVASNLDIEEIGPLQRFLGVAAVWLALVAAAEVCARGTFEAAAGPLRVLAVLAYGATIFQVAQSLQVPAYAPHLLLAWALGGLAFSYATRALAALTLSVAVLGGWLVWAVGEAAGSDAGFVVGLAFAMPLAAAVAALHDSAGPPALRDLGDPWWVAAACFGLIALFAAAIPDFAASADDRLPGTTMTLVGLACVVLGAAAVVRSPSAAREVAAAFVLAVVAVGLVLVADEESAGYVLAACGAFLVAAVAVAALGASRSLPGLTNLAFLALLVFVAVQSFGLMADILSGAALLLTVGVLLLVIGLVLDRGRRALLREAAR